MKFDTLGLSANIIHTVKQLGFTKFFSIQTQAIPPILAKKDVMGIAPTGSGKTASFVMPILDQLQHPFSASISFGTNKRISYTNR